MSIERIRILLDEEEYEALFVLSEHELRPLPSQVRHIVRDELMRRGLLKQECEGQVMERELARAD